NRGRRTRPAAPALCPAGRSFRELHSLRRGVPDRRGSRPRCSATHPRVSPEVANVGTTLPPFGKSETNTAYGKSALKADNLSTNSSKIGARLRNTSTRDMSRLVPTKIRPNLKLCARILLQAIEPIRESETGSTSYLQKPPPSASGHR